MNDDRKEIFLVLRAQSGDTEALNELLGAVQSPLYRYIARLIGDQALAEDVLQEVFLIIYRKLRWLSDPSLFRPWAYRIASRETFRRLKREKKWREQVRDEELLESVKTTEREQVYEPGLIAKLPALLSEVSPASRAVLILHYLDELSLNETADVLEISPGTAKSRLAYGLQTMRKLMSKQE